MRKIYHNGEIGLFHGFYQVNGIVKALIEFKDGRVELCEAEYTIFEENPIYINDNEVT